MKTGHGLRVAAWAMVTLLLGACGGGGESSEQASGSRALKLSAANARDAASTALGSGDLALRLANYGVLLAQRFGGANASLSLLEACQGGGTLSVQLTDRDGDGQASAGDLVTAQLSDCADAVLRGVMTGALQFDLTGAGKPDTLRGTLSMPQGLLIRVANQHGDTVSARGSMVISATTETFRKTLNVEAAPQDDLRFVLVGGPREIVEALRGPSLTKSIEFDNAQISVSMSYHYESDWMKGSLTISTIVPVVSHLNVFPHSGSFLMRGDNSSVTLATARRDGGANLDVFVDSNGDGVRDFTDGVGWVLVTPGFLWWDGVVIPSWVGFGYLPGLHSATDFSVSLSPLSPPPLNGPFRLQFSRRPVPDPQLQFRFVDNGGISVFSPERVNVDADVTMQGALTIIRPKQALRSDRRYLLQASLDGVDWTRTLVMQDALGNQLTFGGVSFGTP